MSIRYRYYSNNASEIIKFSKTVLDIEKPYHVTWYARIGQYAWKIHEDEIDSYIDHEQSYSDGRRIYLNVRITEMKEGKVVYFELQENVLS